MPGRWLLPLLLTSLAPTLRAQAVEHRFRFALGDEAATVQATFPGPQRDAFHLELPGAKAIDGLTVTAGGHPVAVERAADGRYAAATGGKVPVVATHRIAIAGRAVACGLGDQRPVKYQHEGAEKIARYHETLVLRGASTWLRGGADAPQRVVFEVPPGFSIASVAGADEQGGFAFATYRDLVSAPFYLGAIETLTFTAAGKPQRALLAGFVRDRRDRKDLLDDLRRIVESQSSSLGPPPYASFTFLIGRGSGGRHAEGFATCAEIATHSLQRSFALLRDLSSAHLGAWQQSVLLPAAAGEHPLPDAPPTRVAWFTLGVLDYLAELTLVRAGLHPAEQFFTRDLAARINTLQRDPRRLAVPVSRTGEQMGSRDELRTDGPHPKLRGYLIGFVLDVILRQRTGGGRSIDAVVRHLAERVARSGRGFDAGELRAAFDQDALLDDFVDGTAELPLAECLASIGLVLDGNEGGKEPEKLHPGIPAAERQTRYRVTFAEKPMPKAVELREALTRVVIR